MMKKLTMIVMSLTLCLGLAACGGSDAGNAGEAQFSTDLGAFYDTVAASSDEFPMLMEIGDDMLEGVYPGLAAVERVQSKLYVAAISAVACEIAMVEVADAADVQTVKDIFQARIDAQIDGGAWYPETIEQWEKNAEIVVRGNYVCLFVTPDGMTNPAEAFNAL